MMSDYSNSKHDYEREFHVEYGNSQPNRDKQSAARPNYRTKRRPSGFNGLHRRRQKRWTW